MCSANAFAADAGSIIYASASDAFEKLKADPSAVIRQEQGWSIITLEKEVSFVSWFFPPEENGLRPAVFKKVIMANNGVIETKVISFCEAPKKVCDDVIKQFEAIDIDND